MKGTYPVAILGFENQKIEAKVPYIFTGHQLLVNGQPARQGKNRGEMLLRRDDGTEVVATWHVRFLGLDVPNLIVDGKEIQVLEPLRWYEMTWISLPVLLVLLGGGLGILCGLAGFILNAHIFRSPMARYLKYVITTVVIVLSVVVWYLLGMVLGALLPG
jgi:hypothetical protein